MPKGVINLRGKQYKTVALRVSEFRAVCPASDGWALLTEPQPAPEGAVIVRASIVDPGGRIVATGYAEEQRSSRGVNSTSALENCETSAIGRALAAFGLGGEEYASADELANAITQQRANERPAPVKSWTPNQRKAFCAALGGLEPPLAYEDVKAWCESIGRPKPSAMASAQRENLLTHLRGAGAVQVREYIAAQAAQE